jgi:hypothetical protein
MTPAAAPGCSGTVIATEPADAKRLRDAVRFCGGYAPVAHLELLNYAQRPTATFPGNPWEIKARRPRAAPLHAPHAPPPPPCTPLSPARGVRC